MQKWRNTCPDHLITRIEEAVEARCYILRQTGPFGLLVKEHDREKQFKVFLGSTHSCSCSTFKKEKELCKHILWVLIKKFRISKDDEVVYQLGLCERDLNNVIFGHKEVEIKKPIKALSAGNDRDTLKQKTVDEEDVCPICQEDIFKTKRSLLYCRFGCGNSVHVNCMKIWADHQFKSTQNEDIKCPLCRTEFGKYQYIVTEHHKAVAKKKRKQSKQQQSICRKCNTTIDTSQSVRCTSCSNFWLCLKCFQTSYHSEHNFEFRKSPRDRWSPAKRCRNDVSLQLSISNFTQERSFINLDEKSSKNFSMRNRKNISVKSKPTGLSANPTGSHPDLRSVQLSVSRLNIRESSAISSEGQTQKTSTACSLPPLSVNRTVVSNSAKMKPSPWNTRTNLRRESIDRFIPTTAEIRLVSTSLMKPFND